MELCNAGELWTIIQGSRRTRLDPKVAKFWAAQVALAFEYLHNLDVIFRDLKPENLLVDNRCVRSKVISDHFVILASPSVSCVKCFTNTFDFFQRLWHLCCTEDIWSWRILVSQSVCLIALSRCVAHPSTWRPRLFKVVGKWGLSNNSTAVFGTNHACRPLQTDRHTMRWFL